MLTAHPSSHAKALTQHFLPPSADIAVVEMTDAFRQLSLFYHLGVRESFSMANNIILYCNTNSDSLQSLQVSKAAPLPSLTSSGQVLCFTAVATEGSI